MKKTFLGLKSCCVIIPVLIACCLFAPPTLAQDFGETVVPITSHKVGVNGKDRIPYKRSLNALSYIDLKETVSSEFGTGFCLDPACRFIGTNYHIAVKARPRKINGEKVVQQYLATGPDDEGATVLGGLSLMKYNLSRDLAIFELGRPMPHHHGAAYNLDGLDDGQEVEIYAYPKESINPIRRRSLQQFHAKFKGETATGLLAFDCTFDKAIDSGASGGIVVDKRTQQIVGILNGVAKSDGAVALAVPVQSLAEFVGKVQPYLAERIFHRNKTISPVSADLYPKFVTSPNDVLQRRPQEPAGVKMLRSKAQLLADGMRNFIAVQTLAWGSGNKEPAAEALYEVQIVDGYQRFREYPEGKKELENVPFPPMSNAIVPGGEWSELPQFLGTKLGLKIRQMPDATVNERHVKVFQYQASPEDGLCKWDIGVDYGFLARSKIIDAAVYGEVWTDEDENILRISEHCETPETFKWKDYAAVATYGWLKRAEEPPRLIPLTIYAQAEHKNRTYWCRGQFTDYRMFSTRVILPGDVATGTEKSKPDQAPAHTEQIGPETEVPDSPVPNAHVKPCVSNPTCEGVSSLRERTALNAMPSSASPHQRVADKKFWLVTGGLAAGTALHVLAVNHCRHTVGIENCEGKYGDFRVMQGLNIGFAAGMAAIGYGWKKTDDGDRAQHSKWWTIPVGTAAFLGFTAIQQYRKHCPAGTHFNVYQCS